MNRRGFICALLAATSCGDAKAAIATSGVVFSIEQTEIRLVDILAPVASGPMREPYGKRARAALQTLLAGGVGAIDETAPPDRWGRQPARVRLSGGETLQERLVRLGAARVAPESADDAFLDRLFELEDEARKAARGLWAVSAYRVFDAQDADGAVGAFRLVEGAPLSVSEGRGRIYVNFGADYRTDFTITARSTHARRWRKLGFELSALAGVRLRARGHVEWINGPSIELAHRRQIEILGEAES